MNRRFRPNEPELIPSEDLLIDQALAALESAQATASDQELDLDSAVVSSPTLDALDTARHPQASTVCEHCPNSVWFASPAELKCYCRVMYLVSWSSREPNQITHCDGQFLGPS